MDAETEQMYSLYQIRDRGDSCGLGFDGYHGITNDVVRRQTEHFRTLKRGTHKNQVLQEAYNRDPRSLEFYVAFSGSKEQCEARERLLVPKDKHHWNQQKGGGPRRGMSTEEAIGAMFRSASPNSEEAEKAEANPDQGGAKDQSNSAKSKSETAGAGVSAAMLDVAAATGMAVATLGSGLGTAYVINKTIMKDSESLNDEERDARKVGRITSTAGGAAGGLGSLSMVALAGEVGLGTTGVSTGLAAIGSTVGGGAVAGFTVAVVIPAVAAAGICALGYGGYKLYQKLKK